MKKGTKKVGSSSTGLYKKGMLKKSGSVLAKKGAKKGKKK